MPKPSPLGGSLSWSFPGRLPCWEDCTGGIYAAPTSQTIMFTLPFCRGRGLPRPYRAMFFIALLVGVTPPRRGIWWLPQNGKEGSLRPQARFGAQPPHSGGS